jgi:hypothetical protein
MRRVLSVGLVILVILAGCATAPEIDSSSSPTRTETSGTVETDDPNVSVSGVVISPPSALPDITVNSQPVPRYSVVVRVLDVDAGPSSLKNSTMIVHYSKTRLLSIDTTPEPSVLPDSVITVAGTYDRSRNLIVENRINRADTTVEVTGVKQASSDPPIVGRKGSKVTIAVYATPESTPTQSTYSAGQKELRVISSSKARVMAGQVRVGDTFSSSSGNLVIEVQHS